MRALWLLLGALLAAQEGVAGSKHARSSGFDIRIPASFDVRGEDSYVCITRALPDRPLKLVGVDPQAEQAVVHHILLFGECGYVCVCVRLQHGAARAAGAVAISGAPAAGMLPVHVLGPHRAVLLTRHASRASRTHAGCSEPPVQPQGGKVAVWDCKHKAVCKGQDKVL
jgi:hypothetical protein